MTDITSRWSQSHKKAPRASVAVGAAVRKDDSILFIRQTYGIYKGQWTFPTGFVDPGERPDHAAVREAREEAGIAASVEGLLSLSLINWEGDVQLYFVFLCDHDSGEPMFDGVECNGAAYFSLADLETCENPIEPLCGELARRVLCGEYRLLRSVGSAATEVIVSFV